MGRKAHQKKKTMSSKEQKIQNPKPEEPTQKNPDYYEQLSPAEKQKVDQFLAKYGLLDEDKK